MKKYNILFFILFGVSLNLFSQITIEDIDGIPLNDGDVRIFSTNGDAADLKLIITNNSSKQIELKIRCEDIQGASGEGMSFCVYNCYSGINIGKAYPLDPNRFFLESGASSGTNEVHFQHTNFEGDPDVTTYALKVYEVGNEANNHISFTYKFDVNYSGINVIKTNDIIYPNPTSNFIYIENAIGVKYISIHDLTGKELVRFVYSGSIMKINIEKFKRGIYLCSFLDENNFLVDIKKIVLK